MRRLSNWLARVAVDHVLTAWGFESLPAHMAKMSIDDFAAKADWEGGLYEAVTGYGLKASDLSENVDPEFKTLLEEYVAKAAELRILEDEVTSWFDEE